MIGKRRAKSPTRKHVRIGDDTASSSTHGVTGARTPTPKRNFSATAENNAVPASTTTPATPASEGGQAPAEFGAVAKRQRVGLNEQANRAKLNEQANRAALNKIYETFYGDDGVRKYQAAELEQQLNGLYDIMGKGYSSYLRNPVTDEEFTKFLQTPSSRINSQKVSKRITEENEGKWSQAVESWKNNPVGAEPKKPVRRSQTVKEKKEAVKNGDYFHIHNRSGMRPTDTPVETGRRIIVNVDSQQEALKVAERLGNLFTDETVSPHLKEYKIYLSQAASTDDAEVKHDKLVVYYFLGDEMTDESDAVGDRIATTIADSLEPGKPDGTFGPFYSIVSSRIAWAEEPKHHVGSLTGSFTSTRAQIIANVIKDAENQKVDPDTFLLRVRKAFETNWVDPDAPHRHLEGNPPTK